MRWVCRRARSAVESETMRKLLLFLAICSLPWLTLPSAAMARQPNGDYRARREALAKKIGRGVALVSAGTEVQASATGFRQPGTFFYLTGWSEHASPGP